MTMPLNPVADTAWLDLVNAMDAHAEVITTLAELGPILDEAGNQYARHMAVVISVIAEHSKDMQRELCNLTAHERAL
jgi:hypothetical protein